MVFSFFKRENNYSSDSEIDLILCHSSLHNNNNQQQKRACVATSLDIDLSIYDGSSQVNTPDTICRWQPPNVKNLLIYTTGHMLRKSANLAVSAYRGLSEIDYSYYCNQTYLMACQTVKYVQDIYKNDSKFDKFDFNDFDKSPKINIDLNIAKNTINDFESICTICLDREKNRVVIPCGHTFCNVCTGHFTDCPICRSQINGTMKFYL